MKDSETRKFVEYWTSQRGSEKGEDQQFWNSLLGEVLGMEDVKSRVRFQVPVPMRGTTKFLDAWIPETRVLIEHKSRGVNLEAPQAGHDGLTPYEQAAEYDNARPVDEKARWIVTCNFDEFRIYDRSKPLAPPLTLKLRNLPKEAYRLAFLVDPREKAVDRELEISVQAGRIVGEIYDALLKQYGDDNADHLAALNRLCVRLVFCLYAEDADVFPKDSFRRFLEASDARRLRNDLQRLFQTLDTPPERRSIYLEPELSVFPYTNGGLFHNAMESDIPPLTEEIRQRLFRASQFDWRDITPTIFGALFESTLNPVTRRAGGMVYTSVENIHKVIDPLFLDELARRVNEGVAATRSPSRNRRLLALQAEIASKIFLDPACGSGNFLTETYLCLRRLENRLIAALQGGQGELDLGMSVKVSIAQFHGIEINDFAVSVAKTALWIAEAQMLRETAEILHREPDYLPLRDYANIIEGNALQLEWPHADYIMGNPPFIGASMMSAAQKTEAVAIFGNGKRVNSIDYVGAWYYKAAQISNARCAFVSTNSITQGEQVAPLWRPLFEKYGLVIDFAHRTFRWDNEASEKAHVHCVIIGFHAGGTPSATAKTIFDKDKAIAAANICPYLIDAPTVFIESRAKPLCDVLPMTYGNKPTDDGNLLLTEAERNAILHDTPALAPYVLRYVGSRDFINADEVRYCLWLKNASPSVYHKNREVMRRLAAVRDFRLKSTAAPTRKMADQPWRFFSTPQTEARYLLVPEVSSERRRYVPIGFMEPTIIAANTNLIVPDASLYHFGILTSSVHMAWARVVAGRLKSDYRYSGAIVYNNFPWPAEEARLSRPLIEKTAQAILDARAAHPGCSLADLYDPLTMPPDLRAAHEANDRAVLAAYGLASGTPEMEVVAHLFKLYTGKARQASGGCSG